MAFCAKCGAKVGEGDTFCSKCGAKVVASVVSHLVCPKCGSENIQKYSLWKKSQNKGTAGIGCLTGGMGCIIFVILLIFAPLLLLLLGIGLAVVLPIIIFVAVVAAIAYAIQQKNDSSRYICLTCEHIFRE
jgi:predicted RNA-binding Zn-ribbon protein involved in translation (DUF1610 family)